MIRLTLLGLFVTGLALYAWKDWYRSLCGLILLMAVVEHPDMPKNMLGVQGLNPWNALLFVILLAWLVRRSQEGQEWDPPAWTTPLLLAYGTVIVVATIRLFANPQGLDETFGYMVGEYVINTFKWVMPGLLVFVGCRTRERLLWTVAAVVGLYFLLAIQVIRWMPPSAALTGADLSARSLKILSNEVGYHRVNLSMLLAGASWAALACRPLMRTGFWPVVAFLILSYGQALTGGRAGYVTWAAVGLCLCVLRWRRYLLLAPVAIVMVALLAPGVVERMVEGFTSASHDRNPAVAREMGIDVLSDGRDVYTITAGRTFAWRFVIEKISTSPVIGYGRQAMRRTGLASYLAERFGEEFPHPHNAYLELLLDNGALGFALVMPFYILVVVRSISAFRGSGPPERIAVAGMCTALVLALLFASMGSQTFYPREGAVGMWCAIGLMWRVTTGGLEGMASSAEEKDRWVNPWILEQPRVSR